MCYQEERKSDLETLCGINCPPRVSMVGDLPPTAGQGQTVPVLSTTGLFENKSICSASVVSLLCVSTICDPHSQFMLAI